VSGVRRPRASLHAHCSLRIRNNLSLVTAVPEKAARNGRRVKNDLLWLLQFLKKRRVMQSARYK
jgi:hypothetical protein